MCTYLHVECTFIKYYIPIGTTVKSTKVKSNTLSNLISEH